MTENRWEERTTCLPTAPWDDQIQQVRYQTVCSMVQDTPETYCTYGLECLGDCAGTWVQMDVIRDVSPSRENVLVMANRFNDLALSPLHFRDAVLDSLNA